MLGYETSFGKALEYLRICRTKRKLLGSSIGVISEVRLLPGEQLLKYSAGTGAGQQPGHFDKH